VKIYGALNLAVLTSLVIGVAARAQSSALSTQPDRPLRIAAIVTVYHVNSHADVIVSRLLKTDTMDGKGRTYPLELVSLYVDQFPDNDISRGLSRQYGFPIYPSIREALTCGTDELAVDGVLLIAEHGKYDKSETGNTRYPKRRFFDETIAVFRQAGRVVPVFMDKHVADNWKDIHAIYSTAKRMNIPMMAGSSLPVLWRHPPVDVQRGAKLDQIVVISYHTLDAYGFHALEIVQSLAERRAGGETGIKAVRCLSDEQTWTVLDSGECDSALFQAALDRHPKLRNGKKTIREAAHKPTVMIIEYADGLKAFVFTLNRVTIYWSAAWKRADGVSRSAWYPTQERDPFIHFSYLLNGIEQMFLTGKPTWPVERTVLTSGALDDLLRSLTAGGTRIETPHLMMSYQSDWNWTEPPPFEE